MNSQYFFNVTKLCGIHNWTIWNDETNVRRLFWYINFILLKPFIFYNISGLWTMFLFVGNSLPISCNSGHSISLFYWTTFKTLLFKNSKTKMDTLHTECSNSVASCCAHDKCCFQSNLCQF